MNHKYGNKLHDLNIRIGDQPLTHVLPSPLTSTLLTGARWPPSKNNSLPVSTSHKIKLQSIDPVINLLYLEVKLVGKDLEVEVGLLDVVVSGVIV